MEIHKVFAFQVMHQVVSSGQFCLHKISLPTELASSKLLGRVLPWLMGMCHWMGLNFHNYNEGQKC